MRQIQVLDCTLRDGGYCNECRFGFENTQKIIRGLVEANIDIVECGFLTNRVQYEKDVTRYTSVDAEKTLGLRAEGSDTENAVIDRDGYTAIANKICSLYGCKYVATTLRKSYSASVNGWGAMLFDAADSKAYFSREYEIQLVDRVGGGDSFAAGLIYGLITRMEPQHTIEFATAASCLKHTIEGDFNRTTIADVENLLQKGGNGRVQR